MNTTYNSNFLESYARKYWPDADVWFEATPVAGTTTGTLHAILRDGSYMTELHRSVGHSERHTPGAFQNVMNKFGNQIRGMRALYEHGGDLMRAFMNGCEVDA